MNVKFRQMVAILVIGIGLLTACIAPPSPAINQVGQAAAETSVKRATLKVGVVPFLSNAILKIAQEEGYFAEQGLDVELIVQQSSNEFIPLLLQGELDIAAPTLTAGFFNAVANGGKLKIALPLTTLAVQDCPVYGIVARRSDVEAGIYATPAQWKGAKITLPPAGAQAVQGYLINHALQPSGLTLQDVALTPIELPAQAEALRSGQTDLVLAIEPWVTRMTSNEALALLTPAEPFAPNLMVSQIIFGAKVLANPAIGERFAVAYLKAVRQYSQGKTPRNVALVAAYTQLEAPVVERICWSASSSNGEIDIASIQSYQTWLQEQGLVDRLLSPEEFTDLHFAQSAIQVLGTTAP